MVKYFAYGSNMDKEDLDKWCKEKNLKPVTFLEEPKAAVLYGWELAFNYFSTNRDAGAANIMEVPGKSIYGLLLVLGPEDFAKIARKEGSPTSYAKVEPPIKIRLLDDGRTVNDVHTFKVIKTREEATMQKPKPDYMRLLISNARHYGFSSEYISMLENIETATP